MGKGIRRSDLEYLINHQDSLYILQDLTPCLSKLELLNILNKFISYIKHLRSEIDHNEFHCCRQNLISCIRYQHYLDPEIFVSQTKVIAHRVDEILEIIKQISKLELFKKRLAEK